MGNSINFRKILEKCIFQPLVSPRILSVQECYLRIYIAYNIAVIFYICIPYVNRVCVKFPEASKMDIFLISKKNALLYNGAFFFCILFNICIGNRSQYTKVTIRENMVTEVNIQK